MAQSTYSTRALVLRKTKLNESDLICTMLAQDGSQIRAVAKGARKPTGSFASRLELFCETDLLLARGRNLDIVKEARLVRGNAPLRYQLEHTACASVCVEYLDRVSQMGLQNPTLFSLTEATFSCLCEADAHKVIQLCAAFLLKAFAYTGVRPSLAHCVMCGESVESKLQDPDAQLYLSYREGGVLCESCHQGSDAITIPSTLLSWAHTLLHATLARIEDLPVDDDISFALIRFCQQWSREHLSVNLKSLNFLFTCTLPEE